MPYLSPDRFVETLRPGMRLYLAGAGGEPTAVLDALARRPERLSGSTLTGVVVPGVDRYDRAGLAPDTILETFFVTPELRAGFEQRRIRYRPLHYSAIPAYLSGSGIDLAILRVAPPRGGIVSLGLAHDFAPALSAAGVPLVGVVDPGTPFAADGECLPVECFSKWVDGAAPPVLVADEAPRAVHAAIAARVAALIEPGDTVQVGIGATPTAVLAALGDHRDLALHGGMVTDAMLRLIDKGVATSATGGIVLGSAKLAARIADEPRIRLRRVGLTHDAGVLAAISRFVAVNGAVEVDLFGQVNGEMVGGRQISGHGGMADFVRGARHSPGGRAVTVLTASGGRPLRSRIVPALASGTPVAITRADVDVIVTEHGVAHLRDTDLDTRAERLIAVADPAFRGEIAEGWDRLRCAM